MKRSRRGVWLVVLLVLAVLLGFAIVRIYVGPVNPHALRSAPACPIAKLQATSPKVLPWRA